MAKAIVLGAYGMIGAACVRGLRDAGFHVVGMGRSERAAMASDPDGDWMIRDIAAITAPEWQGILSGVDVVVNASGALQDGGRDDLEAIHVTALDRLVAGIGALPIRLVQISAAGVSPDAGTPFFRTKARGDAIVAARANDWVILRPTLVLAPEAYGGTALLRAVAALPFVVPRVFPDAQVQTVFVGDVVAAVVAAATEQVPSGTTADLSEPEARTFPELTAAMGRWLGLPAPRFRPAMPVACLTLAGKAADMLGHLGWRSPLRTNALSALGDGIRGDPAMWNSIGGRPCQSFDETLARLPATRQERVFARLYLALPLAIVTLAVFWCLSGLIALCDVGRAVDMLVARGVSVELGRGIVVGGALCDIALGLAIMWRGWVKPAALGMIALSAVYLIGGVVVAPDLWGDPLGPMVKVLPGVALAGMVWMVMEER